MQLLVCLSHLYGDSLYYATSLFDHYVNDISYCRPEGYYFWLYYFCMNFIWIVVPFCESIRLKPIARITDKLIRGMGSTNRLSSPEYSDAFDCGSVSAGVHFPAQIYLASSSRRLDATN